MRVIYIDIDSLRPDHLGCYGYSRGTSPNIDRLADESAVFSGAYVSSSPCMPSRACALSGRFGINHGVLTHWGPGSNFRFPGLGHKYEADQPIFTRHLRQHGYKTVSFSSFMDRHQAFWFSAGWEELHTHTLKQGDEDADEVNAAVIPWLRQNAVASENLFLHLQYWDPHRNYTVDRKWIDELRSADGPEWLTEDILDLHLEQSGPFSALELFPNSQDNRSPVPAMPDSIRSLDDCRQYIDGYDGAVRFLDAQLGELFGVLDELGILDETAIIISADHGEALGEGGVYGDHVSASEVVHNVPLIVKWPGIRPGLRKGLLYQLDLLPTICDLLQLPTPVGWDGVSFHRGLVGDDDWRGRDLLIWDHALYSCQRVVRTHNWLFQRTYHPGLYDFEEFGLFEITSDRPQLQNCASDHPNVVADLDGALHEWRSAHGVPNTTVDPMDEILASGGPFRYITPDVWSRRLRERGRHASAARLAESIERFSSVTSVTPETGVQI